MNRKQNLGIFKTEETKDEKSSKTDQARDLALTYSKAQQNQQYRRGNTKELTRVFKLLIKHFPFQEVSQVLPWFLAQKPHAHIPKAPSVYSFCEKYAHIRNAWEIFTMPAESITPAAQAIMLNLSEYPMKNGLKELFPALAQRCLDRFQPYKARMLALNAKLIKEDSQPRHQRAIAHLQAAGMLTAKTAICIWLEDHLRGQYVSYAPGLLFDPAEQRWHNINSTVLYEWCEDGTRWQQLYSVLESQE